MGQRTCAYVHCGVSLPTSMSGKAKFCSRNCGNRHRKGIIPKPDNRSCVRCSQVLRNAHPLRLYCCLRCQEAAGYERTRDKTLACLRAKTVARRPERFCEGCGVSIPLSARADRRYCSKACYAAMSNGKKSAALRQTRAQLVRMCAGCGTPIPLERNMRVKFCSYQCGDRANTRSRKLRVAQGHPSPLNIVAQLGDRDGWRCELCRRKINRLKTYPHPLSPSVDHIVPKSKGGDNNARNLRLTHLRCNVVRRARAMNDQLRLIG